LGRVPGSVAVLEMLIGDIDVDVRREAAHSLGVLGDPGGVPALLTGLKDPNSFVRRWAADGLAPFAARPEVEAALETAMHDPAAMVAMSAAKALRRPAPVWRPPHPADVAEAMKLLQHDDPTTRKDACKFLAQVDDDAAQDALLMAAKDSDSEVRKSAVEALGWDEGLKGTAALAAALQDVDPDVVVTALEAFRRRGDLDKPAVQGLLGASAPGSALLSDGEVWLRLDEAIAASSVAFPPMANLGDERASAAFARRGLLDPTWVSTPTPWLVQLAIETGAGHPPTPWQLGVLSREDLLVHLRFSWTDEADRVASHRALRAPVVREYGHPDRG
jgi:HEAT repeat protein